MKHRHRLAVFVSVSMSAAASLHAGSASAQSFGTAPWVALTRSGLTVTDGVDNGSATDVVGSSASPPAYAASDATFFYARVRVNDKPTQVSGDFIGANWACFVDTNGVLNTIENMIVLAGQPGEAQWRHNALLSVGSNVLNEPAEVLVASFPRATHGQATSVATGFSGNDDWLVDVAVPWATIRAGGNGAPAVIAGTPFRFVCGTGSTFGLDLDQATASGTLSGSWSDPLVCGDTGCLQDSDGDGVPNAVETTFGTSTSLADSDGDGIPDNVELSSGVGPYGPYTGPDTDADGTRDALDTDSDGDGLLDSAEGVGDLDGDGPAYRDADDDNDGILTKAEIADAVAAGVSDDVDGDGLKNWIDLDSDGDGSSDEVEGRGDADGDGIPDYLDKDTVGTARDAGLDDAGLPAPAPEPAPGADAGSSDGRVVLPDDGVLSGTGLLCASRPGSNGAAASWLALATGAFLVAARLRRRERP